MTSQNIAAFRKTVLKTSKMKLNDLGTIDVEYKKLNKEADFDERVNQSKGEVLGKSFEKDNCENLTSGTLGNVTFDGFQASEHEADARKKSMCPKAETVAPQICTEKKKKLFSHPKEVFEYASVNATSDAKDCSFKNKENLQKHNQSKYLTPLRNSLQQSTLRMSIGGKNVETKFMKTRKNFLDKNNANILPIEQEVTNNKTNQTANSEVVKLKIKGTLVEVEGEKNSILARAIVLTNSLAEKNKKSKTVETEGKPKKLYIELENGDEIKNENFDFIEFLRKNSRRSARIASLPKVRYTK